MENSQIDASGSQEVKLESNPIHESPNGPHASPTEDMKTDEAQKVEKMPPDSFPTPIPTLNLVDSIPVRRVTTPHDAGCQLWDYISAVSHDVSRGRTRTGVVGLSPLWFLTKKEGEEGIESGKLGKTSTERRPLPDLLAISLSQRNYILLCEKTALTPKSVVEHILPLLDCPTITKLIWDGRWFMASIREAIRETNKGEGTLFNIRTVQMNWEPKNVIDIALAMVLSGISVDENVGRMRRGVVRLPLPENFFPQSEDPVDYALSTANNLVQYGDLLASFQIDSQNFWNKLQRRSLRFLATDCHPDLNFLPYVPLDVAFAKNTEYTASDASQLTSTSKKKKKKKKKKVNKPEKGRKPPPPSCCGESKKSFPLPTSIPNMTQDHIPNADQLEHEGPQCMMNLVFSSNIKETKNKVDGGSDLLFASPSPFLACDGQGRIPKETKSQRRAYRVKLRRFRLRTALIQRCVDCLRLAPQFMCQPVLQEDEEEASVLDETRNVLRYRCKVCCEPDLPCDMYKIHGICFDLYCVYKHEFLPCPADALCQEHILVETCPYVHHDERERRIQMLREHDPKGHLTDASALDEHRTNENTLCLPRVYVGAPNWPMPFVQDEGKERNIKNLSHPETQTEISTSSDASESKPLYIPVPVPVRCSGLREWKQKTELCREFTRTGQCKEKEEQGCENLHIPGHVMSSASLFWDQLSHLPFPREQDT